MAEIYRGDPMDERAKVSHLMEVFANARLERTNFEPMWEEGAALCWPEWRNSFSFGRARSPGQKWTQYQVDSHAGMAAWRFMSIADAVCTPFNSLWSRINIPDAGDGAELKKIRAVRQYFYDVTRILWQERYSPRSNFIAAQQLNWHGAGVFGNMGMFVDELDIRLGDTEPGLRYIPTPAGSIYWLQDYQGRVDGFIRHIRWTARSAMQKWPEKCPPRLRTAAAENSRERFDFLHFVLPRGDYDPRAVFTPQGKPYESCYVCVTETCIVEEGGYRTLPEAPYRYTQADDEVYGRGPAQIALAEMKTLNAEKAMFLKQGHRAADPALALPGDDGLFDFKNHPGSHNFGFVNQDGRPMVHAIPTGEIQVTDEMLQRSERIIDGAFLVDLFPAVFGKDGERRDPRQMLEALHDRAIFLSPLGRSLSEYNGPLIERELDLLSYLGKLPPMPGPLREARGRYLLQSTSPLARALDSGSIAGYMRTVAMAAEMAKATGNPESLDHFDLDVAVPEIGDYQFAPPRWMASPEKVAQVRKARAQQVERDRQTKELPGKAAIMKAQAISDKAGAGMNTGGVLSGTAEGGMPLMPGQTEPGGRAF